MKNLIIDTDSGMDDLIAILMLLSTDSFNIKGITTVFGLVEPNRGRLNLLKLLNYINVDIDVFGGYSTAFTEPNKFKTFPKSDIKRSTQLPFFKELIDFNVDIKINEFSAIDYYKEIASKSRSEMRYTFVCLGPLTNIASAILKIGEKFTRIVENIIIMGGAIDVKGNVPPLYEAEYNIFLDPFSASTVLNSGIKCTLVPLDACFSVPATKEFKDTVEKLQPNSSIGQLIQKLIISNQDDFGYFYDPLVSSILISPDVISKSENSAVKVLIDKGSTLRDEDMTCNNEIITKVDSFLFFDLLSKMIS